MARELVQFDSTPEIRALLKQVAARRGMTVKALIHLALAREDAELGALIQEQLGIVTGS